MPSSDTNHRNNSLPELILASSSPYRRQLLARLGLPFSVFKPEVDEQRLPGENGTQSVERLARAKARAVEQLWIAQGLGGAQSGAMIIGSDQLAVLDGQVLGKPGTEEAATRQLLHASGNSVEFVTAIAVLNTTAQQMLSRVISNRVWFRDLTRNQIEAYLKIEQPLDCAGSFKAEGLGIALFKRIEGHDPNALIGLPLIALCSMLEEQGLEVLTVVAGLPVSEPGSSA